MLESGRLLVVIDHDLVTAYWAQSAAGWWPHDDDDAADRAGDLLEAVAAAVEEYTGRGADALVALAEAAPDDDALGMLGAGQVENHLGEVATRYRRGDSRPLDEFERRLRSSRALQVATRSAYSGFLDPPQMWLRLDAILGSKVDQRHQMRRWAVVTQAVLAPLVRLRCVLANRSR